MYTNNGKFVWSLKFQVPVMVWTNQPTKELTNQLTNFTNSTEQCSSWEDKSSLPSQEIPWILWNPVSHLHIYKN
jgi:hypothetical protein